MSFTPWIKIGLLLCLLWGNKQAKAQLLSLEDLAKEKIYYSIDQAVRDADQAKRLRVFRRAYSFPTAVPRMLQLQWLTMNHTLIESVPESIKTCKICKF
jgi:hypothetical protein